MRNLTRIALLGAAAAFGVLTVAGAARAQQASPSEVAIPFVNKGGVRDWEAVGDDKLYIQAANGNWYLATLATPSPDLPFATKIGFETKGVDRLDRFGSVVVGGTRYALKSLVASEAPPPKPER